MLQLGPRLVPTYLSSSCLGPLTLVLDCHPAQLPQPLLFSQLSVLCDSSLPCVFLVPLLLRLLRVCCHPLHLNLKLLSPVSSTTGAALGAVVFLLLRLLPVSWAVCLAWDFAFAFAFAFAFGLGADLALGLAALALGVPFLRGRPLSLFPFPTAADCSAGVRPHMVATAAGVFSCSYVSFASALDLVSPLPLALGKYSNVAALLIPELEEVVEGPASRESTTLPLAGCVGKAVWIKLNFATRKLIYSVCVIVILNEIPRMCKHKKHKLLNRPYT